MKVVRSVLVLLIALHVEGRTFAADNSETLKAIKMIQSIGQFAAYSYDYTVKNTYPNGKNEIASGNVSMDFKRKFISEKGTYSTTLLTNKWYYKAEHTNKTLTLIDLEKYYRKNSNAGRLDHYFDSKAMQVPDSVYLKHGKLESFSIKSDIVTIRFSFRNVMNLDTYELVYDKKNDIPVSIYVKSYSTTNIGIIYQEFKCTRFNKTLKPACFSADQLFDVKGGKVVLKQYKAYKSHFEL